MSFFDSKEEVINIELTQHGKELFSKGKFEPKYYAFFDEDIIYDNKYANISESQNEIEQRILEKSIFLKPHIETTSSIQNTKMIGTSNSLNKYVPSWKLKIIEGASINEVTSSSLFPNIPQINLNESYVNVSYAQNSLDTLDISVDNILLELEEENVFSLKENFEVSLYEINGNTIEQIQFGEKEENVKNGILMDQVVNTETPENDPKYAEYYFTFMRDKKININKISKLNKKR